MDMLQAGSQLRTEGATEAGVIRHTEAGVMRHTHTHPTQVS